MGKVIELNEREARIQKLKRGDLGFGCRGMHHGNGSPDCPRRLHHHHDIFCALPTDEELREAGVDPDVFMKYSD